MDSVSLAFTIALCISTACAIGNKIALEDTRSPDNAHQRIICSTGSNMITMTSVMAGFENITSFDQQRGID